MKPVAAASIVLALMASACGPSGTPDASSDAAVGTDARDAIAIDGPGFDATPPACDSLANCIDCTAATGCGYCVATARCLAASAEGTMSADGTCATSSFSTDPAVCTPVDAGPSGCDAARTCGDCGGQVNCGWCTTTRTCLASNDDGSASADGTCAGKDFDDTGACATDCTQATTCDACARLAACGWCGTTGRCVRGTASGSDDAVCTGAAWKWLVAQCADPVADGG